MSGGCYVHPDHVFVVGCSTCTRIYTAKEQEKIDLVKGLIDRAMAAMYEQDTDLLEEKLFNPKESN